MFLFKEGSRNAMNNERQERKFRKNFKRVFRVRLPHMDTVDEVMRVLEETELEKLKQELIRTLLEKKVFRRQRFLGKYYQIVIDGTHTCTVEEGHCPHCLHKTYENGTTWYFHNVLEAKLVFAKGFCISIGSQWIENETGYEKQDCELKAWNRLAERLKEAFPHLSLCIQGDGLYPNETFFKICRQYLWEFIVTFKDGNLPTVWQDIAGLAKITHDQTRQETRVQSKRIIERSFRWFNDIAYASGTLHFFECVETVEGEETTRFAWVSSLKISWDNILQVAETGRLRWMIENEGFNIQKNEGYGLTHRYSRVSYLAMKNYYQCLQIAHLLNQLFEKSSWIQEVLVGKMTLRHLWKKMLGQMRELQFKKEEIKRFLAKKVQIRFV